MTDAPFLWKIVKSDRYPGLGKQFPGTLYVDGTRDQAKFLADHLSNYFSGCDEMYVIVDGPDGEGT